MLSNLLLILFLSPIIYAVVRAFVASKDYYDYNEKKSRYIPRFKK
jgi:hypothetical protein